MLRVRHEVVDRSFEHLRECGSGSTECVVFWVGPLDTADYVDEVVHPHHKASAVGYDVDSSWIGEFWLDLAARGRTIRAQVHTHPGSAFHSSRDDGLPLIHTAGYLSLVIPNFAKGPANFAHAHLAQRTSAGTWSSHDSSELIEVA